MWCCLGPVNDLNLVRGTPPSSDGTQWNKPSLSAAHWRYGTKREQLTFCFSHCAFVCWHKSALDSICNISIISFVLHILWPLSLSSDGLPLNSCEILFTYTLLTFVLIKTHERIQQGSFLTYRRAQDKMTSLLLSLSPWQLYFWCLFIPGLDCIVFICFMSQLDQTNGLP